MGDSEEDRKKRGVPSWQLKTSVPSREEESRDQDSTSQPTPSRASTMENARRFLLEDEVRNAPTDKQIAFLESKGLGSHEIQELLGVTRNIEATGSNSEPAPTSETSSKETSSQKSLEASSAPLTQTIREVPPIITYPEFLITPTKPPLVTARRLLGTLYLFGGLSALLYGTNHYLVTPMIATLTASRHELAGTAQENIDKLITKLQGMVSETPQQLPAASLQEESEEEESDSDPTELFHRDIGVQTSLPTSPLLSRSTSPSPAKTTLEDQTSRISRITSHITDLNDASTSEGQEASQLSTCIGVLRDYLESLAYTPPSYTYGTSGLYGSASQKNDAVDDEIAKVKAQIRGVKGVLLNARSFPAGTWQGRVR